MHSHQVVHIIKKKKTCLSSQLLSIGREVTITFMFRHRKYSMCFHICCPHLHPHPPGGMVCSGGNCSIFSTCLRGPQKCRWSRAILSSLPHCNFDVLTLGKWTKQTVISHCVCVCVSVLSSGYQLFCKEQLSSMTGSGSKDCYVAVWAQRWRDLTERQRDEYSARCREVWTHMRAHTHTHAVARKIQLINCCTA